ncbi:hypothetical protein ASD88_25665 [Pelomonas sp. Root662]|nr:hypothetical protein ASC81_25680 [Pelomonas sp. Root405]KRA75577.1 hypothetical protein ASD88_25665 [Pelomonas sp. Root662]
MRDERGQQESWSLSTFMRMNDEGLLQVDASGAIGPQYSDLSKEQIARAQARLDALRNKDLSKFSVASLERFAAKTRQARNDLEALVALVDDVESRGNRQARLDERSEDVIRRAIKEKYNTKEAPTKVAAFKYYRALCEQMEEDEPDKPKPYAVSKTTFYHRIKEQKSINARKGKRVAYQLGKITVPGANHLPVHGVLPHEVCYIDHTPINLATVSGDDPSLQLHKPWLSIGEDGGTLQARAMLLLYAPPSASTVLLVMRDYVRRHGRLPRVLSVDNGKEFKSGTLREFCRLYGIDLRYRPPGEPRGAAPVEAALGAAERERISSLVGNTISLKDPRLTTKSMNGFNFASHTLVSAYNILQDYYFTAREHRMSDALGMTPHQYEIERQKEAGARKHVIVSYDRNLMLLTSPHAKRPFHKVEPRRGVWVDGMWYAHADLRELPNGTKVEVRVEPFAARVVYVNVAGRWKAAVGINSRHLDGRTRREVAITARAHSSAAGTAAKTDREAYKGEGFNNFPPEAYDARLAGQQREEKYLLNMYNMLGALKPGMLDTGDDREFDVCRNPSAFGMHVGKADDAVAVDHALPAPTGHSGAEFDAASPALELHPRRQPTQRQDEDALVGEALEEFL